MERVHVRRLMFENAFDLNGGGGAAAGDQCLIPAHCMYRF